MRRIAAIAGVVLAAVVLVVLATGSSDGGGTYQVRAIFRNAFSVIPGEDVKIAGVVVGSIGELQSTANGHKAAVVLDIEDPGFQDFRTDATCTIRPQGLIGERFVECTPTQPRPVGAPEAPPLPEIRSGEGKGQYLLPETNTITPVDLDLVQNIMRLPYRQRFTVILNELGLGLGARGQDLRRAIRLADPGLRELDKVLAILAKQNKVLADLATDSTKSLGPLAKVRTQLADSFTQQNTVNQATAEESAAFEKNLQLLPSFLRELTPTMVELQGFSDSFIPVLDNLSAAAPSVNTLFRNLPAFAQASTPALQSLGDTSEVATTALLAAKPYSADLKALGKVAKPTAANLNRLLSSLRTSGGLDYLLDFLYYGVGATNGYDSYGHYLRAELLTNLCTQYTTQQDPVCNANFSKANGAVPYTGPTRPPGTSGRTVVSSSAANQADIRRQVRAATAAPRGGGSVATDAAAPAARRAAGSDPSAGFLDYLLGNG